MTNETANMTSSGMTPSRFLLDFDAVPTAFLNEVYPAIAQAVSMPVYYAVVLYVALYGIKIYSGKASLTPLDIFQKVLTIFLVFMCLNWYSLPNAIYTVLLDVMESTRNVIVGGVNTDNFLDAIWNQCSQLAKALMSVGLGSIFIGLMGLLIYLMMSFVTMIAMMNIVASKMMLAIAMVLLPLLVACLLWANTRQFFMNWVSKMLNAVLMYILTFTMLKFGFQFANGYLQQATLAGDGIDLAAITFSQIVFLVPVFGVLAMFLLKVKEWSASLSGGVAVQGLSAVTNFARSFLKFKR